MTSEASDHSDLIHLDIHEAMRVKFMRGREHYENGPWVGPPPIYAAHDEVLDFLVYINKASDQIGEDLYFQLMKQGLDLIQGVRVAILIYESERGESKDDEESEE